MAINRGRKKGESGSYVGGDRDSEMKKTISKVLNQDEKIVIYPKTKEVIGETQQRWKRKW